MRKSFYVLLFLLVPAIVSAEVKHTRSFADPSDSSSVVIDITVNDYDKDINCGGLKFWGVQAIEHQTGNRFSGSPRFVSSAVLSQTFTLDLPLGDFEEMTFICSDDGDNEAFQFGSIENDLADDQVIFEVTDDVVLVIPEVLEENATTTSITSELSDGQTVTASIDGIVIPETFPVITNTEDVLDDSGTAVDAESQTAAVIFSDTNAESITSPLSEPDKTATSTPPEENAATSTVSADTNSNGTTTTTF